jgi:hypothetical protein
MSTKGIQEAYEQIIGKAQLTIEKRNDENGIIDLDYIKQQASEITNKIKELLNISRTIKVNFIIGESIYNEQISGKILTPGSTRERIPFTLDLQTWTVTIGEIQASTREKIETLITSESEKPEENPIFDIEWEGQDKNGVKIKLEIIDMQYFLDNRITQSAKDWRLTIGGEKIEIISGNRLKNGEIAITGTRKSNNSPIKMLISHQAKSTLNEEEIIEL